MTAKTSAQLRDATPQGVAAPGPWLRIARRFFRKKYDAQQVLAQFARTARDETDLDALTAELTRVVQETLQPTSVSVWLKSTPDEQRSA